jgi:hypothetical protein
MNNNEYILTIQNKRDKSLVLELKINEEQKSYIVVYLMENDKTILPLTDKEEK